MASSQVEICNMALANLGVTTFIAQINERSKEAGVCRLFFDSVRDTTLEAFDWAFARRRVRLALTNASVTNWAHAYAYPSDCISARRIVIPCDRRPRANERIPFEVSSDGQKRLILCDLEDAELVYTVRVEDPNLFSASFVAAMSAALSARIAMPLTVSTTISNNAIQLAARALDAAVASDENQGQEDEPKESELIAARN